MSKMDGGIERGDVKLMISRTQIDQVIKVYRASKASKPVPRDTGVARTAQQDKIRLSFSMEDIEKVKRLAHASPDIRQEIVEPLVKAVESGEYSVDPESVAEKMLGRLLADRIR